MWLLWSFDGDVRAWLAALLFPAAWRGNKRRKDIAEMAPSSFEKWLISSDVPLFFCQLLSCPRCWSAHVAGAGSTLMLLIGVIELPLAPLVWACGAGIGNFLYVYTKRPHKN